ncbi:PHF5-like protein [Scheffersomyces coipomensis]|uniref:PHF5-like protein n=1 Tax=Scheffersomyces coipomensis TaxID=1788519 RepID=UPI00315D324D
MSRHQYDLVQCMKQPGTKVGRVCLQCEGKCPMCDSLVKPTSKVYICSECCGSLNNQNQKCILCNNNLGGGDDGSNGGVDAYYCLECVRMEKHREGCPRILNLGSLKSDYMFNKKKLNSTKLLE